MMKQDRETGSLVSVLTELYVVLKTIDLLLDVSLLITVYTNKYFLEA